MMLLSVSQLLWWNVCLLMNINKLSPYLVSPDHSILNPLILSLPFPRHLTTRLAAAHWPFSVSPSHVYTVHTHTDPDFQCPSVASDLLCPLAIHHINTNTPLKNVPVAVLVAVVFSKAVTAQMAVTPSECHDIPESLFLKVWSWEEKEFTLLGHDLSVLS